MSTESENAIQGLKTALGIDTLETKIDALAQQISALQPRAERTTLAGRVDELESSAGIMSTRLDELIARINAFGDVAGDGQVNGWRAEVERLSGLANASHSELLDHITRIDAELVVVNGRLDGHDTTISEHSTTLTRVAGLLETEVQERQMVGESAARAHARLDNLRLVPSIVGFIIGAGIMFLVNLIWDNSFEDWNTQWNTFHWVVSIIAVGLIGAALGTSISGDAEASASTWSRVTTRRQAASAAPTPPAPPTPPPAPVRQPAQAQN